MAIEVNKKFVKLGRSWGIIIPPWFLKILEIDPEKADLSISIENNKIIIQEKTLQN